MDIISGKWKGVILFKLMGGTKRFKELKATIPDISQKMLSQQLRELEHARLVVRKVYPQIPPKVEYSLTNLGKSLESAFERIRAWGKQNQFLTLPAIALLPVRLASRLFLKCMIV